MGRAETAPTRECTFDVTTVEYLQNDLGQAWVTTGSGLGLELRLALGAGSGALLFRVYWAVVKVRVEESV